MRGPEAYSGISSDSFSFVPLSLDAIPSQPSPSEQSTLDDWFATPVADTDPLVFAAQTMDLSVVDPIGGDTPPQEMDTDVLAFLLNTSGDETVLYDVKVAKKLQKSKVQVTDYSATSAIYNTYKQDLDEAFNNIAAVAIAAACCAHSAFEASASLSVTPWGVSENEKDKDKKTCPYCKTKYPKNKMHFCEQRIPAE